MFKGTVLCVNRGAALSYAAQYLQSIGIPVSNRAGPDITHLLLPVPSFSEGDTYLAYLLSDLPDHIIVSGGNLKSPLLEHYRVVDFLQDPWYQAKNAAITARCTVKLIREHIADISGSPVLITGWGRIGKCLAQELRQAGAEVTVAARKVADVAILHALGYGSELISHIRESLSRYRLIINTVPELILPGIEVNPNTVVIELASRPGITGRNIIVARGLPGKMAPEESGKLIAETFVRLSI